MEAAFQPFRIFSGGKAAYHVNKPEIGLIIGSELEPADEKVVLYRGFFMFAILAMVFATFILLELLGLTRPQPLP
ncbi:MAG: hypothetical protein P8Z40_06985, partial [Chloroflexota bacterium]